MWCLLLWFIDLGLFNPLRDRFRIQPFYKHIAHQSYGTHVAPLGLGRIGLPMFYKHAAPLGLGIG